MIRLLTVIAFMGLSSISFSQNLFFGTSVGLNHSQVLFNEAFISEGNSYSFNTTGPSLGISGGLFVRMEFKKFFLQTELAYCESKSKFQLSNNLKLTTHTITENRLDMPILIGTRVGPFLRMHAGPVISHMIDASMVPASSKIYPLFHSGTNLGYQMGVSYQKNKASFAINYGNVSSENNLGMQVQMNTFLINQKSTSFQFTFRYN